MQGAAGGTNDDFAWPHLESVPAFELDVTEVTVEAYQACLDAGACTYEKRGTDCNLERERGEYMRDPVNCVTWAEAVRYCDWREAELPTDGMWEYAAGGRHDRSLPWAPKGQEIVDRSKSLFRPLFFARWGACREGDSVEELYLPQRARYKDNTTCPVGSFPHGNSIEGVQDLAGNVAEWTQTPYCRHHKKLCQDGFRTVKGGGFDGLGGDRRQIRMSMDEKTWRPSLGFRCARVVHPPKKGP
jgi:formylglycine-generating enzyme required for sulfatase activity